MIIHRWKKKRKRKKGTANEWPFPFEKGGIERSGKFSHLSAWADGGGFRIRKRGGNLERVRIEARNIRPSLKRRLEQRGGVSRLNHSSAHRPPFPLS